MSPTGQEEPWGMAGELSTREYTRRVAITPKPGGGPLSGMAAGQLAHAHFRWCRPGGGDQNGRRFSPQAALYTLLVYAVVQQLETNIITPLAQRWDVQLPPALGFVGLVVLASLFGLPGLIFAAPLTVVGMVLERFYTDQHPVLPDKEA